MLKHVQKHENLTAKYGRKSIEQYKKINMLHMYDELQMRAAYKKIFLMQKSLYLCKSIQNII